MANEQMGMAAAAPAPEEMAIFDQMRQQISPKEFSDEMLAGASQADPQAVAQFKAELDKLDVPPEVLDALNNLVDEILANPDQYDAIRKKYMDQGIPEDILPEQFDPHFFAALNMAIDQLIAAPAGPQAFAKGGIAELKPIAKAIAGYGRNGDTMLAHITPAEARMLKRRGGSGTINPVTGLPEFFNLFKSIGNAVKKFASSTVGRIVTTVALGFFLGPAAASMLGVGSVAGVAAVSGFVGSAGATLLGGGNIRDALKAGAIGGLTAGVTAGVTAGFDTAYTGPTTVGGQWDKFTNAVAPGAAPAPGIAPTSAAATPGIAPDVTNLPAANPADFGAEVPGGAPTGATAAPAAQAAPTQAPGGAPVPEVAAPATGAAPIDATATPGPLAEPKLSPTGSTGLFDQAKDFYSSKLSPSGIQSAAEPMAQKAGADAMQALQARLPNATPAMLEQAYQTAYKAAMPGVLATYGPAVGAGLGIMGLAGGFSTKGTPESALKGQLMTPATQRIANEGSQKQYYVQGLPGVQYDQYGAPSYGAANPFPTVGQPDYNAGGFRLPGTIGQLNAVVPRGTMYSTPSGAIGSRQVYQPYNTASMYTNLLRGYAGGGEITPITSNLDNQKLPANFNWEDYVRANPDLARSGIDTREEAENHWLNTGLKENRVLNPGELAQRQTAAADLAAQQKASRDAKAQAKAVRRAAGSGNMYANINAGLSALAPENFPGGPVTLAPEREQAMRTAFAQGNPQSDIDYARIMQQQGYRPEEVATLTGRSFGDINRRYNTGLRQDAYAPMLDAQRNALNQQTGIMVSTRLPQDISGYTPEQKGGIYMQLARQGLTDAQIRAAAENAYGAQTDNDWKILQGVVGQMQQPGFQGVNMDRLIGQRVTPPPGSSGNVSIQGGLDQYGNLYGSQPYHYGRGPLPTAPNFGALPGAQVGPPKTFMNTGGIAALAQGGYPRMNGQISGPGTEKSDSIPAMLSDGEFVMTAKAVRGAGKGNRREGAKKMYQLMHQLERNAQRG